jgi:hypothetical protein
LFTEAVEVRQGITAQQAEVLLTLSRTAMILARTLPDEDDVREYLETWVAQTGAWAGRLILGAPELHLAPED